MNRTPERQKEYDAINNQIVREFASQIGLPFDMIVSAIILDHMTIPPLIYYEGSIYGRVNSGYSRMILEGTRYVIEERDEES